MTVKEYLHQAYRLDQRIKSDTMEAQNLREMAGPRADFPKYGSTLCPNA